MSTDAAVRTPTELADGLVKAIFEADPLRASLFGVHDWAAEVPDLSEAAEQALAARMHLFAAAAAGVDRAGLSEADRITLDVVGAVAAHTADFAATRRPEWQVTDLWVAPAASMLIFLPMVTFPGPGPAESYVQRLAGLDGYLRAAAGPRPSAGSATGSTSERSTTRFSAPGRCR